MMKYMFFERGSLLLECVVCSIVFATWLVCLSKFIPIIQKKIDTLDNELKVSSESQTIIFLNSGSSNRSRTDHGL